MLNEELVKKQAKGTDWHDYEQIDMIVLVGLPQTSGKRTYGHNNICSMKKTHIPVKRSDILALLISLTLKMFQNMDTWR
jgi:hypothetical protein